jgi:hypothetical protein
MKHGGPNERDTDVNGWTNDVNEVLDKIRVNSIKLSNEHKKTYFIMASYVKWFRVPVIVFSAVGSVLGIGLSPYLTQLVISEICSIISMVVSLIGSLELFLAISTKMENELVHSKELYLLSIEIQKTLLLDYSHRNGNGMAYLEEKFGVYSKLIENSHLMECRIIDELTPLPNEFQSKLERAISDSSPSTPKNVIWRILRRRHRHSHKKTLTLDVNFLKRLAHRVKPEELDENDSPLSIDNEPFYYNNVANVGNDDSKDGGTASPKHGRRTSVMQMQPHVQETDRRNSVRRHPPDDAPTSFHRKTPPRHEGDEKDEAQDPDPLEQCEEGQGTMARTFRVSNGHLKEASAHHLREASAHHLREASAHHLREASAHLRYPKLSNTSNVSEVVYLNNSEKSIINRIVQQVRQKDRSILHLPSRTGSQGRSVHRSVHQSLFLTHGKPSRDTLEKRSSRHKSALFNVGPLDPTVPMSGDHPTPSQAMKN